MVGAIDATEARKLVAKAIADGKIIPAKPAWKPSVVRIANCQRCARSFELVTNGQKFCGKTCASRAEWERRRANHVPRAPRVCTMCGTTFPANRTAKTCSVECSLAQDEQRKKERKRK